MKKGILLSTVFILLTLGFAIQVVSQPKPVDPVNWKVLIPFLPDIEGWKARGEARGSTVDTGSFKITQVEKNFTDNGNRLKMMITDGGYFHLAYAGFRAMSAFELDTSEEYSKKTNINGYTAIENYKYKKKLAMVIILVAERFIVHLEAKAMKSTAELKEIASKLDLKKLAKLAK
jgi:hypothetical protein